MAEMHKNTISYWYSMLLFIYELYVYKELQITKWHPVVVIVIAS